MHRRSLIQMAGSMPCGLLLAILAAPQPADAQQTGRVLYSASAPLQTETGSPTASAAVVPPNNAADSSSTTPATSAAQPSAPTTAAQASSAPQPNGSQTAKPEDSGSSPPPASPGSLTPADAEALAGTLKQRLEQVQADEQLAAETKEALIKYYQQAIADLERARALAETAASFRQRVNAAPQLLEAAKREKEQRSAGTPPSDAIDLSELSYEQLLSYKQQVESDLAAATARRTQLVAEVNKRATRRKELPQLISSLKAQIEQAVAASTAAPAGLDAAVQEAQNWANTARLHAMAMELASLEAEMRAYDAEAQLLPLQVELAQMAESRLQQLLRQADEELAERRKNRILSYRIDFSQLDPPDSPPFDRIAQWLGLQQTTRETASNQSEHDVLTWQEIAQENAALQAALAELQKDLEQWRERRGKMEVRVEGRDESVGGFNTWVGLMLRKQRMELPDESTLEALLRSYQQKIDQADSLLFDLEDALGDLRQIREHLNGELSAEQQHLLELSEEILTGMRTDVNDYLTDLYEMADVLDQTIQFVREYRKFIDEHVLWIRSSSRLGLPHLSQSVEAFTWLVSAENWASAVQLLWADIRTAWWAYALVLTTVMWLVLYGSRLRRKLAELSQKAAKGSCTKFSLTGESTLLTLLLALPLPLLLWGLAWRFRTAAGVEGNPRGAAEFLRAWAAGLEMAAIAVVPMETLRQICRSNGLGDKHFGWDSQITALLKTNLRWLIDISLPLIGVMGVLQSTSSTSWAESLGRICFLVLMVILSLFLAQVFRPRQGIFSRFISEHPNGWLARLRYVWYSAIVAGPLLLAMASAIGYHYTAQRIANHLSSTAWMIVALVIVYSLLSRWLLLSRRKLMIAQARQRLEEAAQRESSSDAPPRPADSEEVNLVAINEQTRRLLFSFAMTAGLIGAYYIWSDVLPAISLLNRFELWQVQGATPDETVAITLAHLILVIPIVVLVTIAARNVPGLLEIFLQHLPITKAAKYAITTLVRYCIVALGIILVASTIGLRWSSVQWLVAALGVGLGFGLQEIFANFVSGLILLFEQPIRVGDIVTVDGVTGTVSRIRIRATTIVNWDRQELIVPNKDMITGKLLNWTLGDTTNRITLNVGVAYGSDIVRACEVVGRICQEHEAVLKDPPPMVTFESFGDSSLNIVVRAYLQSLENRLRTIHELHQAIYLAFAEEKIEIPFPQRDLHIRSLDERLARLLAETGHEQRAATAHRPVDPATDNQPDDTDNPLTRNDS
ncbi:MAG: potassium transporter [Pirellulaceae bacterium]|nr:MAG: potassium transporter [Pirellulaceae bacterium]